MKISPKFETLVHEAHILCQSPTNRTQLFIVRKGKIYLKLHKWTTDE